MRRAALIVLAAAAVAVPAAPASAAPRTVWLCKPDRARNPCKPRLTSTVLSPSGKRIGIERARPARRPKIDCFYVYPTVSDQKTNVANRSIDPELRAVARYQAARFSRVCRVFAPAYRQVTLAALLGQARPSGLPLGIGYRDVRDAWRRYLRRYNKGRGVVLIGHSQGAFVLRRLLAERIEKRRSERRRLVSALLLGAPVKVRKSGDRGGDFKRVRACRSRRQTGCVIAYNTFGETPPANSIFGRVPSSESDRFEVLCTNPARLAGGRRLLDPYFPTSPFPGTLGAGIKLAVGVFPTAPTPFIKYAGSYRAHCSRAGGAHVLRINPVDGARRLRPLPNAGWGLHLADVNIALGDLTRVVKRQAKVYVKRRRR